MSTQLVPKAHTITVGEFHSPSQPEHIHGHAKLNEDFVQEYSSNNEQDGQVGTQEFNQELTKTPKLVKHKKKSMTKHGVFGELVLEVRF